MEMVSTVKELTMDLVSVIIPIYGVEQYLDRCVRSVVNQSYAHLEIILVDDGSTDRCPAMCDAWANKDSRIQVIHKPNGGLSSARNAGLDMATGEFIAFVDSDDYVEPDYIATMIDAAQKNHADLVMCSVFHEDADGNAIEQTAPVRRKEYAPITDTLRTCSGIDCMRQRGEENGVDNVVAWNKLYRCQLWKDLRYPVGKLHEDEFVTYRIFGRTRTAVLLPERLYHYIERTGSIMHTKYTLQSLDIIEALIGKVRFLLDEGARDLFPVFFSQLKDSIYKARQLDWSDAQVHKRLKELFRMFRTIPWSSIRYLPFKDQVNYMGTRLCPFLFWGRKTYGEKGAVKGDTQ